MNTLPTQVRALLTISQNCLLLHGVSKDVSQSQQEQLDRDLNQIRTWKLAE